MAAVTDGESVRGWFSGRLPDDWFEGAPEVSIDRDEILVVGKIKPPDLAKDASEAEKAEAITARIDGFREDTRRKRMRIATEAQRRYRRHVSWGVECQGERRLFTTASIPAMTRLRMPERQVLDTLVDAGVARSRSEALGWCVRLVGDNESEWIGKLREAFAQVEEVRKEGPTPSASQ